jgi:hypothetical protein
VRTTIINDLPSDNGQTFTLTATNTGNGAVVGTGTIFDNGTGDIFNPDGTLDNAASKNDDRPVTINDVTVNEASPYAVFTVTGATGQYVKLALADGTATSADYGSALEYYNGTDWVPYTANSFVQIPAGGITLLVRTTITNDIPYEVSETFTLTATNTGTTGATGTATIKDDGTGSLFSGANNTGIAEAPRMNGLPARLNDDRSTPNLGNTLAVPLVTINDVTVNEASPFAVFTVTGAAGQSVKLALADGTATGADYGPALEYYNGTSWVSYNPDGYVQIPVTGTTLLVRTAITNDIPYEMSETFTLTVFNTRGIGDQGIGTIKDDGKGSLFSAANTTGIAEVPGSGTLPALLDDDRPVNPAFVTNLTVNEGSHFAVFLVTGVPSAELTLTLTDGSAVGGKDFTSSLEYWNGSDWLAYNTINLPVLDNVNGALKVRVAILQDQIRDGGENFQLSVQYTGFADIDITPLTPDANNIFSGYATIVDDGTGSMWDANGDPVTPATGPVVTTGVLPDDDRPLEVSDVTVNEASPYAVFIVTGATGQYVKLALADGTATGADYGSALEYYNGNDWVAYTANSFVQIPVTGTSLLVRTTITNDIPYEGSEIFTLTAFNTGGIGDQGTGTIKDDGTGSLFSAVNTTGIAEAPRTNGLPARLNDDNSPLVRNIGPNIFSPKPIERPPVQMGNYEFNSVVLDFNGVHGGINQFGLPHVDSTGSRGALSYSNATPYASYDRVTDEVNNAHRAIKLNLALSPEGDTGLRNPLLPPDVRLDSENRAIYTLPAGTFVGGKGAIKLAAFTKDGKPLPDWIKFNPVKGNFDIAMPKGRSEPIEIQVVATDAKGDQAKTKLTIKPPVNKMDKTTFIGKPSLVSQIKSAVMLGRG